MFGLFRKKKKNKVKEPVKVVNQEPVKEEKSLKEETVVEAPVVEKTPVSPEPVKETSVPTEPKETEKPGEEAPEVPQEEVKKKPARKMPYHITKHSDGGWQIKRGKAKKALKRFETQKEAIDYAKVLEKEKGESYIIHKADGTTRKKTY